MVNATCAFCTHSRTDARPSEGATLGGTVKHNAYAHGNRVRRRIIDITEMNK